MVNEDFRIKSEALKCSHPWSAKSRNLVGFHLHAEHEQLHESFPANFGFKDGWSRFSVLKNHGTLPGPDQCFSHLQQDARPLFEKLLGLEMEFPGACRPLSPYSSMNYYRSHIEEVFHHTAAQHMPFPPTEGRCLIYYAGSDVLRVNYELVNRSAANIELRVRWISKPSAGIRSRTEAGAHGLTHHCTQQVASEFEACATISGAAFAAVEAGFATEWETVTLSGHSSRKWSFEIRFNQAAPEQPLLSLKEVIDRTEEAYRSLPSIPERWKVFEPLVLRAAGVILCNRFREELPDGTRIPTLQGGKCGVAATWFWDSAISILGLALLKDAETGWGTIRLLCGGIPADGKPFTRYMGGEYAPGAQNPILAWGVWNFHCLCPDREQLAACYEPLSRYVRWWETHCKPTESGLFVYPSGMGCPGLDDALQWQDRAPIALEAGENWHTKDWGHPRPDRHESPDVNSQIYLEMLALANIAETMGRAQDAAEWRRKAETLGEAIHTQLFNPEAGIYQSRSIDTGRFNGIVSLESFLPIYAGITPQPLAAKLCREILLDPERFYTLLPFCTLDRSHEAFRSSGRLYENPDYPGALSQQAYWTGRTWLNYSYWMVGALAKAGLAAEAEEAVGTILAEASKSESLYECYDPLTGTGTGHPEFPWPSGSVLAMVFGLHRQGPLFEQTKT